MVFEVGPLRFSPLNRSERIRLIQEVDARIREKSDGSPHLPRCTRTISDQVCLEERSRPFLHKAEEKVYPCQKIPPSKRFQPPVVPPQPALASAHVWEKTEQLTENGGRSARRRCVVCSKRNHEVRTSHCCKECNAWLCSSECFAKYHSQSFSYKYRNKN